MRTRQLGSSPLQFSVIGLGTWAIGGGDWLMGWGPQDESDSIAAIHKAIDLGINWIDTAAVYGEGRSEEVVGRALREMPGRQRPMIATKCGRIVSNDGVVGVIKAESIRTECEQSLQRLGVDAIDLYQMHWPDPEEDIEEGWAEMLRLKEEGKARFIGVSNYNARQLERIRGIHPPVSVQPPYNMINRGVEDELLAYCGQHKVGIVAYSPMCKGLLTGSVSQQRVAALDRRDHRTRDPKFEGQQFDVHLSLVDGLRPIAQQYERPLGQLAIAWVLRREEVTSAIVGARRPEQIEQTAAAGDWELSDADVVRIDALLQEHSAAMSSLGNVSTGRV